MEKVPEREQISNKDPCSLYTWLMSYFQSGNLTDKGGYEPLLWIVIPERKKQVNDIGKDAQCHVPSGKWKWKLQLEWLLSKSSKHTILAWLQRKAYPKNLLGKCKLTGSVWKNTPWIVQVKHTWTYCGAKASHFWEDREKKWHIVGIAISACPCLEQVSSQWPPHS